MRSRFENEKQKQRHDADRDGANNQDHIIARAVSRRDEIIRDDGLFDLPQVAQNVNERRDYRHEGGRCDDPNWEERIRYGQKGH